MPFANTNGVRLHYTVQGSGPPVLLIMGLGAPAERWALTAAGLSHAFTVCTYDNRGAGRSEAPTPPYTVAAMARDALGLLDALGWERAHVVGLSMGGMIAQRVALLAPGRVRSLGLLATHAGGWSARPTWTAARGVLAQAFSSQEARLRHVVHMVHTPAYREAVGVPALVAEMARLLELAPPSHGFVGQVVATMRHRTLAELPMLRGRFPAMVAVGGDDAMIRPRNSVLLAEALGAELVRFPGLGHALHIEDPDAVNGALRRLFSRG